MVRPAGHTKSEWSYLIEVETLKDGPKSFTFGADEQQRADLARRLGVVSVEDAQATVTVQKVAGGMIHAMGHVSAEVTQNCVVSLIPVKAHVEDEFEGWFGDRNSAVSFAKARHEREAKKGHIEAEILEESVDPEPIIGGKIDLGELSTQFLSLSIDPYPHADGVSGEFIATPPGQRTEEGAALRKNPFEALKDWKEKR